MSPSLRFSSPLLVLLLLLLGSSLAAPNATNTTQFPAATTNSTLLSVATAANLTSLVAAIGAVGGPLLAAVQNSSTAVTVFAPTNEAFAEALKTLRIKNLSDLAASGLLTSILKFHVVAMPIPSVAATSEGVSVPTLLTGQTLKLFKKKSPSLKSPKNRTSSVYVKGYKTTAKVLAADVLAGASIVHVVDKVLVPQLA